MLMNEQYVEDVDPILITHTPMLSSFEGGTTMYISGMNLGNTFEVNNLYLLFTVDSNC